MPNQQLSRHRHLVHPMSRQAPEAHLKSRQSYVAGPACRPYYIRLRNIRCRSDHPSRHLKSRRELDIGGLIGDRWATGTRNTAGHEISGAGSCLTDDSYGTSRQKDVEVKRGTSKKSSEKLLVASASWCRQVIIHRKTENEDKFLNTMFSNFNRL